MQTVVDVAQFLNRFAPPALAESWDNVGLLVGKSSGSVRRVMTCLTITASSAREAIAGRADLIVSHHPLPFRPLKRLTDESHEGRLLLDLIAAGVAIYSPHTAFDSAREGINQRLASGLQLADVEPLLPAADSLGVAGDIAEGSDSGAIGSGAIGSGQAGGGRAGNLVPHLSLGQLAERVKRLLGIERLQVVGPLERTIGRVAVACGSAGEFLDVAREMGCQCLVTGEMRFHGCLEAEAWDLGLVLAGHFASERFAVVELADVLAAAFPALHVWASQQEKDPIQWL